MTLTNKRYLRRLILAVIALGVAALEFGAALLNHL